MSISNRAVNGTSKLYSGSVSNPMLLFVKQCTLSGIKIQCVVALSLILEAVEGNSSHRVRLDMKVVVVVSRFSWVRHVIMTLWVWVQVAPHFLSVCHPLCCHLSKYYVPEVRKECNKMSWIWSVFWLWDWGSQANTTLSHRGSLMHFMHFNKLWSEGDDSHWELDPSCWVISSAVERTLKYLTHRWDLLLQLNSNF